jgi:broad specificity phosphatase PhoE
MENTMFKLLVFIGCLTLSSFLSAQDLTTIYLVRHAEKVDSSRNSDLTEQGKIRAEAYANLLQEQPVTHVFSTAFVRTRNTAAPTAFVHSLDVETYDADKANPFVSMLKTLTGSVLVVGHSNTIPALVNLLTGEHFNDLDESVYDKVFIVKLIDGEYSALEIIHTQPRTPLL